MILGIIVLLIGLFLSDSVLLLFQVFPRPILGVILFFAGVELALVIKDIKLQRQNLFVLLVTAGAAHDERAFEFAEHRQRGLR